MRGGNPYAGVIDQEIQSRLLPHESFRPIFHAFEVLQVHLDHMKVEWLFAGCFHFLYGRLYSVWGATSNVNPGAMESKLEGDFITDS